MNVPKDRVAAGQIVAYQGGCMTTLSLPDAPVDRWLEAARERRSRRSFDGAKVDEDLLTPLQESCELVRPAPGARAVLAPSVSEDLFKGIVGSYGGVTGASTALLFVGSADSKQALPAVGYTGEALILEATALGLGTCWVGGMFDGSLARKAAGAVEGEKVFAVSPVGDPMQKVSNTERLVYGMRKPKPRKPVEHIAPDLHDRSWPTWARPGVEAARIAPSASNRQPWRFRAEGGAIVLSFDGPDTPIVSKRLDCGIAMLHFELAVRAAGASGSWDLLEHRADVARFTLG
jgi:nitroreductase